MSTITQSRMQEAVVDNVISEYVKRNQMFTVYQIWKDTSFLNGSSVDYNMVRNIVESRFNYGNYPQWTRTVGDHLRKLDNTVGKVGEPPQIYHLVGSNVKNYDPNFRMYNVTVPAKKVDPVTINVAPPVVSINIPAKPQKKPVASNKPSGLFRFNVWVNGQLLPCNLRQVKGEGGKFVKNQAYQGYGVLDDGSPVIVKQDKEGKLYAISQGV